MKTFYARILAFAIVALPALAEIRKDIEYGHADGERLLLDVNVPDGPGPFPVAVLVHGGGWEHGDKSGSDIPGNPADISPWFAPLTAAKFTWFSINYRLKPKHPWPAGFEDVQTAIRWVKTHAGKFKGDPSRIALFGHSAGGNLVALAGTNATRDTRVQALVLFAAALDFPSEKRVREGHGLFPALQDLRHRPVEMTPEVFAIVRDPWPIDHVNAGMPPVLIVHGTADTTVLYYRSRDFQARLRAAGVPCDFITIEGAPHSLIEGVKIDPSYKPKMIDWLRGTLAGARSRPFVKPDITVSADGSGDFKTVQEALDSIPRDHRERRTVFVKEGLYREAIRIGSPGVTLRGESRRSTRIEFARSSGRFTPQPKDGLDSAVVNLDADDCILENLSIENTHTGNGERAVAISVRGDRTIIIDCDVFSEGNNTLTFLNPRGRYYLARLNVRGSADAIYLAGAGYMTNSTIYETSPSASATISGHHRTDDDQRFVVRNCRFEGAADWHLLRDGDEQRPPVFFLDCRFSSSMGDRPPGTAFFYNSHHVGGDYVWHQNNLGNASSSPSPEQITAKWIFNGDWEPEQVRR